MATRIAAVRGPHRTVALLVVLGSGLWPAAAATAVEPGDVRSFLDAHCAGCHGGSEPAAEFTLPTPSAPPLGRPDLDSWKRIHEQLAALQMPPADAPQPSDPERRHVLAWLQAALTDAGVYVDPLGPLAPGRGNMVDHEALFSGAARDASGTPDRVWRVTNTAYQHFLERVIRRFRIDVNPRSITHPWRLEPGHDFSDYSTSHRVGEAEIAVHLRNSERVATAIRVNIERHRTSPIKLTLDAGATATPAQVDGVVRTLFEKILDRPIEPDELQRYGGFLRRSLVALAADEAFEQLVVAILCHPEVLYRLEPVAGVRGLLAPRPLARSLALTLTDREPDPPLLAAVADGTLASRDDVSRHARRILDDPAIPKPRLLGFFREYVGYATAADILKCRATLAEAGVSAPGDYLPSIYVADTDRLIESIIEDDRQVLRELLTTTRMFVLSDQTPARAGNTSERRLREKALPEFGRSGPHALALATYDVSLTVDDWLASVPQQLPADRRMGVLTHPSWLIAHGTNFENHAIQRGRWIREKLLGGVVPPVPVMVDAALPDEPDHTLRTRMRVTRDAACWKCHRLMDPLGLPFEQYDHLGRHRSAELVVDLEATRRLGDPSRGRVMKTAAVDSSGAVEASGVPGLDGPVATPLELIRRLADSERVEQVFVRHAFRYFLGRNETLADGPALVAAQRAYREHDGSFKALVLSLVTSDAFLVRTRAVAVDAVPVSSPAVEPGVTP